MHEDDDHKCCDCVEQPEPPIPEHVLKWKAVATAAVFAGAAAIQYIGGEGGIILSIIGVLAVWN